MTSEYYARIGDLDARVLRYTRLLLRRCQAFEAEHAIESGQSMRVLELRLGTYYCEEPNPKHHASWKY